MGQQLENTGHGFWEFKKYKEHEWFRFQILLLLGLAATYLLIHYVFDYRMNGGSDYEIAKLNVAQLQQVDEILSVASEKFADSAKHADAHPYEHLIIYLSNEFDKKWETKQKISVEDYLKTANAKETKMFLQNTRFKVRSNFWLIGPSVYWEIVFWSWFGVICSVLFSIGIVSKDSTTDPQNPQTVFDSSEIPSQIAKLLYAPMCTLIVVLGYNFFSDEIVDIESSKGVIVFAFIGGFYSSRLISLLDRLKEVILPATSGAIRSTVPKEIVIKEIKIDLELDDSIEGDLRNDIIEIGFGAATVTFTNEENGKIIGAIQEGADQEGIFVVEQIAPGKYLLKASWSGQVLEELVNLTAEEHVVISSSEQVLKVLLRQSGLSG